MEQQTALQAALQQQRAALQAMEAEAQRIENSDTIKENATLKAKLAKLEQERLTAQQEINELSRRNRNLQNALQEQIYSEKLKFIQGSIKRMELLFTNAISGEMVNLAHWERLKQQQLAGMLEQLRQEDFANKDELFNQINEISARVQQATMAARQRMQQAQVGALTAAQAELNAMGVQQLTPDVVQRIAQKNSIESFVGTNLINKIGILLIIIGVLVASQYAYGMLGNLLRSLLMFALGGFMLGAGEWLSRKGKSVFALGLISGGAAILYVGLAISYFVLNTLNIYVAVGLCAAITALVFWRAMAHNSQTIFAFALFGGYLPIVAATLDFNTVYGVMAYVLVLNLFALLISVQRNWKIGQGLGLVLNILSATVVYATTKIAHSLSIGVNPWWVLIYMLLAFAIYTLIPLMQTWRSGKYSGFFVPAFLAINTLFSSGVLYTAFYGFGLENTVGLLAVAFTLVYILLGWLTEKSCPQQGFLRELFYLTGIAFFVLIVPLQLGMRWIMLGWLAEGMVLAVYGIYTSKKRFIISGYITLGLCAFAFIWFDVLLGAAQEQFAWRYLAITLSSLVLLGVMLWKNKGRLSSAHDMFKYLVAINTWLYFIYLFGTQLLGQIQFARTLSYNYFYIMLCALVTVLYATILSRIKLIADKGIQGISVGLQGLGLVIILFGGWTNSPMPLTVAWASLSLGEKILSHGVLWGMQVVMLFAMYDILKHTISKNKGSEALPTSLCALFLLGITQNLIVQYGLEFSSIVISFIYMGTAFAMIVGGFIKRYAYLRRFGLGLALLAVCKLFLIDLYSLTSGYRIVSYFGLGLGLLAVSFVYQHFNKQLGLRAEDLQPVAIAGENSGEEPPMA